MIPALLEAARDLANTCKEALTMGDPTLTAEYLRTLFQYDPETGEIIRLTGYRAGHIAGWVAHGRREIGLGRDRRMLAHRLAWLLHNGCWPSGEIDHRNGNALDNRISNLRDVTGLANLQNTGLRVDNTSGHPGVDFDRGRWRARIKNDGVLHHLGRFTSMDEAVAAYVTAKRVLHPSWASGRGAA